MATVFTPYTDFVVVLAGLMVGAAALVALAAAGADIGAGGRRTRGDGRASGSADVLPVLWRGAAGNDAARSGLRQPDPGIRHEKCFFDRGLQWQLGFVAWIQSSTRADKSFAVNSRVVDRACFQLVMLPRRLIVRAGFAPDWSVRIGDFSPELRRRIDRSKSYPRDERRVRIFEPGLALIRER